MWWYSGDDDEDDDDAGGGDNDCDDDHDNDDYMKWQTIDNIYIFNKHLKNYIQHGVFTT